MILEHCVINILYKRTSWMCPLRPNSLICARTFRNRYEHKRIFFLFSCANTSHLLLSVAYQITHKILQNGYSKIGFIVGNTVALMCARTHSGHIGGSAQTHSPAKHMSRLSLTIVMPKPCLVLNLFVCERVCFPGRQNHFYLIYVTPLPRAKFRQLALSTLFSSFENVGFK